MKQCPVFVTREANVELVRICDYLTNVLHSKQAADNFLDEVERQKEIISALPEIYGVSLIPEISAPDGRIAPVNKYVMVYVFDGDKVVILHVFHSTQDYGRLV